MHTSTSYEKEIAALFAWGLNDAMILGASSWVETMRHSKLRNSSGHEIR